MTEFYRFVPSIFIAFLIILPSQSQFLIKGKVKKRNTVIQFENNISSTCHNDSVLDNVESVKRIVDSSRFIFTGKISQVQTRMYGIERSKRTVFKVLIRRVLKGDLSVLSDLLNFETRTGNSTRSYVFAEGGGTRGLCVSHGWAAILFGDRAYSPLRLLVDPVPLTLDRVRRVRSAVQGK
ncbi:unnamed protein product [Pieris macdunnoughi]|uniref:Uncharacterized protein n=1 Tax=Pieris macdunnoughi TaxID=345717 RepID=A0A821NUM1_9NEOP|nr:unnamed protein product [Pieris macdunnoughi]